MIRSFRSKALAIFWATGSGHWLPVENHARVARQLRALDNASRPEGMNVPGYRFHGLASVPRRWSVWVTGIYRLTSGWRNDDAVDVDIEDYH